MLSSSLTLDTFTEVQFCITVNESGDNQCGASGSLGRVDGLNSPSQEPLCSLHPVPIDEQYEMRIAQRISRLHTFFRVSAIWSKNVSVWK